MLEPALAAKQLEEIADGTLDGGFLAWRDLDDPAFKAVHLFDCKLKLAMPRMGNADGVMRMAARRCHRNGWRI